MARKSAGQPEGKGEEAQRDVYEMALRVIIGLLANFAARRLREWRLYDRDALKAQRRMMKMASRGKKIPEGLKEQAFLGLGRRESKRLERRLKKIEAGRSKKRRARRLRALFMVGAAALVAYHASRRRT